MRERTLEVPVEAEPLGRARDGEAWVIRDELIDPLERSGAEQSSLITQIHRLSVCAWSEASCVSNSLRSGS